MSDLRRDLDYLVDIEDAIHHAIAYTEGISWEEYIEDRKTQDAVVRNLEVLGEASKKISIHLCREQPNIPWQEMAGTRDRLIHHYFGINQEIVWQIVKHDLPDLRRYISALILKLSSSD
jgi:uncharacterized protein with HEPN domain